MQDMKGVVVPFIDNCSMVLLSLAKTLSPIPWQVSVQFAGTHICGGTILDTSTILSAAHCFHGYGDSVDGFYIRAGSRKWSSGGQVC